MPITIQPATLKYKNSLGIYQSADSIKGVTFIPEVSSAGVISWTNDGGLSNPESVNISGEAIVVEVSGTTPTIVADVNHRYVCGEVSTLDFTPCSSGICDIVFTSGTTPTTLTVPNTIKWANDFDPTSLDASTIYELNVMDGVYGVVGTWT